MHSITAARLRENWKAQGNPPCKHPEVELESASKRYLTGKHVCTTCGAILSVYPEETRCPLGDVR
jgi:hypothetical protein